MRRLLFLGLGLAACTTSGVTFTDLDVGGTMTGAGVGGSGGAGGGAAASTTVATSSSSSGGGMGGGGGAASTTVATSSSSAGGSGGDGGAGGAECTGDPVGTPCSTGLCQLGACVPFIPVVCAGAGTETHGCNGQDIDYTITYGAGKDTCHAATDVGYCAPGEVCTVFLPGGGSFYTGTCK